MDVVRTNIDQIGGTIDIKSVAARLPASPSRSPLTLAIVSALIVEAAATASPFPQFGRWSKWCGPAQFRTPHRAHQGHAVLRLRNKLLPLMHLRSC